MIAFNPGVLQDVNVSVRCIPVEEKGVGFGVAQSAFAVELLEFLH